MDRQVWEGVQEEELRYHLRKDQSRLLEINLAYWRSVLERAAPHIRIEPETRVLDVGCGSCGVLLGMDTGKRTGIDPLMDRYLETFTFLKDYPIDWVTGTAEETDLPGPYDLIVSGNAIDHTFDPARVAARIDELLVPGGRLMITLNCHNTSFFRAYYQHCYRVIDRFHPHHFHHTDIPGLFPGYRTLLIEDLDPVILIFDRDYREQVLKKKNWNIGKNLKYLLNPVRWPMVAARVFGGRRIHRSKPDQQAIFSNYLFVLEKPELPSA